MPHRPPQCPPCQEHAWENRDKRERSERIAVRSRPPRLDYRSKSQRVASCGKPARVHAKAVVGRSAQNGRNGASPEKYCGVTAQLQPAELGAQPGGRFLQHARAPADPLDELLEGRLIMLHLGQDFRRESTERLAGVLVAQGLQDLDSWRWPASACRRSAWGLVLATLVSKLVLTGCE